MGTKLACISNCFDSTSVYCSLNSGYNVNQPLRAAKFLISAWLPNVNPAEGLKVPAKPTEGVYPGKNTPLFSW